MNRIAPGFAPPRQQLPQFSPIVRAALDDLLRLRRLENRPRLVPGVEGDEGLRRRADDRDIEPLVVDEQGGGGPDFLGRDRLDLPDELVGIDHAVVAEQPLAEPHHLVVGAFQAEVNLPEGIFLGPAQFPQARRAPGELPHGLEGEPDRLRRLRVLHARVDEKAARLLVIIRAGADRVGQAVLLAHVLEKARTHVLAQDHAHEPEGRPARIVPRHAAQPDDELRLLDRLAHDFKAGRGLAARDTA
jgi:hypothetical protein